MATPLALYCSSSKMTPVTPYVNFLSSFFPHRIGFPMMLGTTFVATVYLIICHVALEWDNGNIDECINPSVINESSIFF